MVQCSGLDREMALQWGAPAPFPSPNAFLNSASMLERQADQPAQLMGLPVAQGRAGSLDQLPDLTDTLN